MSIDTVSRNFPAASAANTTTAENREASALKRTALQADQAEALAKRRQTEQPVAQAAINVQGQPTGYLINIIA